MSSTLEFTQNLSLESLTDFENYLQTRRENTTYNGIELESEGWQKEIFGLRYKK